MDWGRKWLVGFNAAKTQPVSSKWSNNTDAIDVKIWEESAPEKKTSFKMMMLPFVLNWIGALTFFLLLKLPHRKL